MQQAAHEALEVGFVPAAAVSASTSGSTGRPLQIYFSSEEHARRQARFERAQLDAGSRLWYRRLRLLGGRPRPEEVWNYLPKRLALVVHARVEEVAEILPRVRPDVIRALPCQLELLAHRIRESRPLQVHPRLLIPGGGILTTESKRLVEETFQAPVRPLYASWEFSGSPQAADQVRAIIW